MSIDLSLKPNKNATDDFLNYSY
ncbi:unnamed protein product, partial [Brachionus calyciflorus]